MDSNGRLWLLGRCAAEIQDSRGQLYPFAFECVANEYSGVRRAAFVNNSNKRVLVIEPTATYNAEMEKALLNNLTWASVDAILCVQRMPTDKRHNAKIEYPSLRRLLAK